jgi:hypothetical protein
VSKRDASRMNGLQRCNRTIDYLKSLNSPGFSRASSRGYAAVPAN